MGQWGRFLQIKHEAYPEPLNYTVSASVRCLRVVCGGGSDLMALILGFLLWMQLRYQNINNLLYSSKDENSDICFFTFVAHLGLFLITFLMLQSSIWH